MSAALRRRRFRPPVLSRLTLAWTGFVLAAAALGGWTLFAGEEDGKAARIALVAPGEVDVFAPPLRSVLPDASETAAALPALREGSIPSEPAAADALFDGPALAQSYATDAEDMLANEGDWLVQPQADIAPLEQSGGVVITVDGAPARRPGERVTGVRAASLSVAAIRIPEPEPALLQKTSFGSIPKIAADGRRASRAYARPFAKTADKRVAIIIAGLGLNPTLTERAINELPPEVTLAFAPYARDLDRWTARAREAGHEIMIELPMEGHGDADTLGPAALLTTRTEAENLQRLDWLLSRFGGYFGVTNYGGARFASDPGAMGAVLARLDSLGLAYIDDTGAARRAISGANEAAVVNRMIAPEGGADATRADLSALETLAAQNGAALGKAYAYPAAMDAIRDWIDALEERDVTLAPASAVIRAESRIR